MPQDISSVRLARLNNLMRLLSSAPCVPRKTLIEALECATSRTLERDLSYLREQFGAEITWDPRRKGYVLQNPGVFVMRLTLSEREATALVAGLGMACHFLPHFDKSCSSLWDKIRSVIPERLAQEANRLSQSAVVALPVSPLDSSIFETLIEAIHKQIAVEAFYTSPYDMEPKEKYYNLSPWGIYFRAHAWYLWAWSHTSDGERIFRISRFRNVRPCNAPSVAPPEDSDLISFAGGAWYAHPGKGIHDVAVMISPPMSRVVAETQWHISQRIEEQPDGSIILRARVPHIDEIAHWILATAPLAEALEPEDLRYRVLELAQQMAKKHGKDRE